MRYTMLMSIRRGIDRREGIVRTGGIIDDSQRITLNTYSLEKTIIIMCRVLAAIRRVSRVLLSKSLFLFLFLFFSKASICSPFSFFFFFHFSTRVYPPHPPLPPKCMSSPAKGILDNPDLSISADNMSWRVERILTFIVFSINQGGRATATGAKN